MIDENNTKDQLEPVFSKIEEKLGFHEIKKLLFDFCVSNSGKNKTNEIRFSNNYDEVTLEFNRLKEFNALLAETQDFNRYVPDMSSELKKLSIENRLLNGEEIIEVIKSIDYCENFSTSIQSNIEVCPTLFQEIKEIHFNQSLTQEIKSKISRTGEVKDEASDDLKTIRSKQTSIRKELKNVLNKIFKKAKELKYTPADVELTINNGRLVMPLYAEHKRKMKGLVHDESRTGQTVYFEPHEAIRLNNDLRELIFDENHEIQLILGDITISLHQEFDNLNKIQIFNAGIDLLNAKIQLKNKLHAQLPLLRKMPQTYLSNAQHPVLLIKHGEKKTVPFSLKLDNENRILILSGPNAGGKSICLKAVGLLQYMVQAGVPVPADEKSEFGIFKNILVDIGDDQSIDSDLSTYSAHLSIMKEYLNKATEESLLIFDEFGSGTDPEFGGAIAEAIIEEFNIKKCKGIISSHYGNIKLMAGNLGGIQNGTMQFDVDKLQPTFELLVGKPGSSYALELAEKIGISKNIIESTKEKLGGAKVKFDILLNETQRENKKLKNELLDLQQTKKKLEEKYNQFVDLSKNVKDQKLQIINNAKLEAQRIIKNANKEVEGVIRKIKESQADKEKTKEARHQLKDFKKKVQIKEKVSEIEREYVSAAELKVGDNVQIKNTETIGIIAKKEGENLILEIGTLKTRVSARKVDKVRVRKKKSSGTAQYSHIIDTNFKPILDIRGMKPGEAINELDQFLNSAILSHIKQLTIIHGRGTGILRSEVRNHLDRLDFIKKHYHESEEFGGDGVTIAEI